MTTFFGFALSDSMFAGNCTIVRTQISPAQIRQITDDGTLTPCLNPSHRATIDAMHQRFNIDVEIPATPPRVTLNKDDSIIVMGVRGLPRLTDRHEYTESEIASATFNFAQYTVVD